MLKILQLIAGLLEMWNSITQFNLIFLFPLLIALGFVWGSIFIYVTKLIRKKYSTQQDKIVRLGIIITSLVGVTDVMGIKSAVVKVVSKNYFVLAFGLPDDYNYIFIMSWIFIILLLLTFLYFVALIKDIHDRTIVASILFSNILIVSYLFYWGIF